MKDLERRYNDLPTTVKGNIRHIIDGAFTCLCGEKWEYGKHSLSIRNLFKNIQWKGLSDVNCEKCRELFIKSKQED
ncbi:hypothetical protein [Clostridium sp. 1001271B_151109_B4]|uniref:hypothetical protein n=1 Tax=Clostridium sp. 1001271B_151109_B4 TaxID=2787148 RepID=UPI0018A957E3|nr:hypothetical protein [Clostridium sp. 1001271B_151109_B4]